VKLSISSSNSRLLTSRQRRKLLGLTLLMGGLLLALTVVTISAATDQPLVPALATSLAYSTYAAPSTPDGQAPGVATPTTRPIWDWLWSQNSTTLAEAPGATSTPEHYIAYIPDVMMAIPTPVSLAPTQAPEPEAVAPAPNWPNGLDRLTNSKLSLHVVRNSDPYIMEFVRRVRPRVIKAVDDLGWLADVKRVSPNTITIGRVNVQNEDWPEQLDPAEAAQRYIAENLNTYLANPGADYWEGWNEFVPVTRARWEWYTAFEAARACQMQALGLRAAVGGFVGGGPEFNEMAIFIPALEAAHRCGGIFTLHEGVSPLFGCGVFTNTANVIPGAPSLGDIPVGYMMLRYRFWYESYLKPRGIGDLPLVISELAVGGIVPGQDCNGPGGASWKSYEEYWRQNGVGPNGPQAYVNLLAWYDSEMRKDPYVIGTTIFTAGVPEPGNWHETDLHEIMIPLAHYAVALP
jgi:hypothetical protein